MKEKRLNTYLHVIIVVLSLWLFNQLVGILSLRWDMTEDKRYTINESTKEFLKRLDQKIYFEIYLEGDIPSNFIRFKNAIREMLNQFAFYSKDLVRFKFIDPAQARSSESRNRFYQSLVEKGIRPTHLNYTKSDGNKLEKIIFPGGVVSKGSREIPLNLLKGNRAKRPENILNQSIEDLEYELMSAITRLLEDRIKKIAYINDHNELDSIEMVGFRNALLSRFALYGISLKNRKELSGYDALIIGKPTLPFTEQEKYVIDQFIMKGGKVVFFLDALSVNMKNASGEGTVAIPYSTNLSDLLFKYGIRINQNFVLDINCGNYPVVVGNIGEQPQIQMLPWPFFPVVTHFSNHPSVRNLDAIVLHFTSSIDTVKAQGIKKIPLLHTGKNTKILGYPVKISFNDLKDKLDPKRFVDGVQTTGYLLEGSFTSLYHHRLLPKSFNKNEFVAKGNKGKVVVIADGDIIRNSLDSKTGQPLPLGVEPFTRQNYANEVFILNLLDYLLDDYGIINARTRTVKIRPLDKVKVQNNKFYWQMINLVLPMLLLLLLGGTKWMIRRKKFSSRFSKYG